MRKISSKDVVLVTVRDYTQRILKPRSSHQEQSSINENESGKHPCFRYDTFSQANWGGHI